MDVSRVDTPWRRGQSVERRHAVTRVARPVLQGGPPGWSRSSRSSVRDHRPRPPTTPLHSASPRPAAAAAPRRAVTRHTHTHARNVGLTATDCTYVRRAHARYARGIMCSAGPSRAVPAPASQSPCFAKLLPSSAVPGVTG